MSMPAWLNDTHPFPNGDNGPFSHGDGPFAHGDPSMAFMSNPPVSLDYSQLQQNGNAHNGIYPTQSVIPLKRPRPREDSIAASPGQASGVIPTTRSQTPQQNAYPGFQGSINGGHHLQGSNPYQQFANNSNTTSPSPIMQNQLFHPQALPQRMQTGSPALFSPPPQSFPSQASPVSSEHGSRNNTPHNGSQAYTQGIPYAGIPGQQYNSSAATNTQGGMMNQYNQNIQQQQRMEEIRQQQFMRQRHANGSVAQSRQHGGTMGASAGPQASMAGYQMGPRGQQTQASQRPMMWQGNAEQFTQKVAQLMQQQQKPFNPHPTVAGQPINLYIFFTMVCKQGGSRRLINASQWAQIASALQVPQQHLSLAAQELHNYWQTNLASFEAWYMQQQRQRAMNEQMKIAQSGDLSAQNQWSPAAQMVSPSPGPPPQRSINVQLPAHAGFPNSGRPNSNYDPRQLQQNGYLTSQQSNTQTRPPNTYNGPQATSNQQPRANLPTDKINAPAQVTTMTASDAARPTLNRKPDQAFQPREKPLSPVLSPSVSPKRPPLTHGGLEVLFLQKRIVAEDLGKRSKGNQKIEDIFLIDDLQSWRPWVPNVEEFGLIDMQALILSLRSGLNAEVRLALDTLATISATALPVELQKCEEIIEALVECADEQVDMLAEDAAEVSDDMLINSYDEMVRGCALENQTVQEIAVFGSFDYELDRAVDRLLCITNIFRNFSFIRGASLSGLADPGVIKLITTVIRYLGTRNMLLRTYQNALIFSKDVVVFLSNVSQEIDLPGKEEASCLLQFLLSFAPSPVAIKVDSPEFAFPHYNPAIHRYYPLAVDILAKLLARDDPNRTLYRSIFLADSSSSLPYETLTRAFGLAIAGVPIYDNPVDFPHVVKNQNRLHVVAQGLLAAEVLSGFIPSTEHSLARSWLTSQDSFALSLVEITLFFGQPTNSASARYPNNQYAEAERSVSASIAQHSAAVLMKLAERAKDPASPKSLLPSSIMPARKRLLDSLKSENLNGHLLRQLFIYAGMYS